MANRAYLLAVEKRGTTWSRKPAREVLAEGIGEIPVFWASLFVPGDRQVDIYDGDNGKLEIATWCAKGATAKRRLKGLRKTVAALIDDRAGRVWEHWIKFILARDASFFKTNAAEVWAVDPEGYEGYWNALLRAFSEPSAATMEAALARNEIRYVKGKLGWEHAEETICKLAGGEHICNLPWLESSEESGESQASLMTGPSLSDRLNAFEARSGMPYDAATMLMIASETESEPIAPAQLLEGILAYFLERDVSENERREQLQDWKLHGPNDVVKALQIMREVGLGSKLENFDAQKFARLAKARRLFQKTRD